MSFREPAGRWPLPDWAPSAALLLSLAVAWANFFGSTRWSDIPGNLHGWCEPWYLAALGSATLLAVLTVRRIGQPVLALFVQTAPVAVRHVPERARGIPR